MMADHASSQSPELAARPSRTGRIAVVIVCVLATAMAFGLAYITTDFSLPPKQRLAMEQIRRLEGFFKVYHRTMGRFPAEEEGFKPLIDGQVIPSVPQDPWGRPYVYLFNNQKTGVVSYGADGVPGGEGENADISSGGLVRNRQ
ncbi:type II secretion system protein GspG [Hyalangium versicolor]|uniref:type II secretion system protein GspG n=1 Tax=Hyalangium versicolor TaxID=2861190 RepID=UPI001CCF5988|nr:type II secretion system protein GspG [Hyalangium versicolor]